MTAEKMHEAGEKLRAILKDLRESPENVGARAGARFDEARCFVLWFMLANFFASKDEKEARATITDGPRDKGADAVLIDDELRKVFVVQAKYHQPPLVSQQEPANHLDLFSNLRQKMVGATESEMGAYLQNANPIAAEKLQSAWRAINDRGYALSMQFVTCGRVSHPETQRFEKDRCAPGKVVDGREIAHLVYDYERDSAPPVRELRLEMAGGNHFRHKDMRVGTGTWIFPMRGDKVGELYRDTGVRIFAANIRGYLDSKTSANREMEKTLETEAEKFFYLNNGVTISCDKINDREIDQNVLILQRPQIINGQQTTRTLANSKFADKSRDALVLVRVFESPIEGLVSSVVRGVNNQNPIKVGDLISNDDRQLDLERKLRRMGIGYGRKRESRRELKKRLLGMIPGFRKIFTKEDFAKAVAGCDLDPTVIRAGLDNLFRNEKYESVFPSNDPYYYMPRCFMLEAIGKCSRGQPKWAYAKWLALRFMWRKFSPVISSGNRNTRAFCDLWMSGDLSLAYSLERAVKMVFVEIIRFYGKESGKKDISVFFKSTPNMVENFDKFWRSQVKENKINNFNDCLQRVKQTLAGRD